MFGRDNYTWLRHKLDKAWSQMPYLARTAGLVWHAARGWMLLWLGLLAVQGLLPTALVLLMRESVDELVLVIDSGGGWSSMQPLMFVAGLIALILLLQAALSSVLGWVAETQGMLVEDHISSLVHRQSVTLNLSFYDSSDYYDHFHRAREDSRHRPTALLTSLGTLLRNGITLIAMCGILLPYGWWIPLVLLVSTLPALYVVLRFSMREYHWRMRTTADDRKAWYYDYLLTARNIAAELRLFDLGDHFISRFRAIRKRLRNARLGILKKEAVAAFLAGLLGLLAMGGVMIWMLRRVVNGSASLGDLVLFYQAFTQGQSLLRTLLENIGRAYSNMLFLADLFDFLSLAPGVVDPSRPRPIAFPLTQGIRFRGVTFRYPGRASAVFEDFDLEVPAGQTVSIVGANGAGKSTLIKLLCRFYDPQNGCIEFDGVDIRELPLNSIRRNISVLFQQPVSYDDTVRENIALGAIHSKIDEVDIVRAARAAGAASIIEKLPAQYATQLGKWFEGGVDLSVGEWQRIALARAFLRDAPIVVLDEPTSAMDSWAEADWLDRFRKLARGKTVMMITHRFTTAMIADTIHVLDAGRVIECGSHDELLTLNGRYAQSWLTQTQVKS